MWILLIFRLYSLRIFHNHFFCFFLIRYGRLVAHRGESGSWVHEFYQRLLPLEYGVMNLPTWGICFRKQVVETSDLMWDVEVMSSMPWMPLLWGRDARLSMAEDEGLDLVCQTVMYKKKQTDRVSCPSVYSIPLRSISKDNFQKTKKHSLGEKKGIHRLKIHTSRAWLKLSFVTMCPWLCPDIMWSPRCAKPKGSIGSPLSTMDFGIIPTVQAPSQQFGCPPEGLSLRVIFSYPFAFLAGDQWTRSTLI